LQGISNHDVLESQLDNFWIGNMKVHVNKLKYMKNVTKPRIERLLESKAIVGAKWITKTNNQVWKGKNQ